MEPIPKDQSPESYKGPGDDGLPPKNSVPPFLIALAIAAALMVLIIVGALTTAGRHKQGAPPRGADQDRAKTEGKGLPRPDPYSPDCAIIRAWLKRQEGEVEVVSWGRRTIMRSLELGDHVTLSARWRRQGEWRSKSGLFTIGPGDIVINVVISD